MKLVPAFHIIQRFEVFWYLPLYLLTYLIQGYALFQHNVMDSLCACQACLGSRKCKTVGYLS